jgi:membrane protease YdiL (CAAX protease family)
VFKEGVISVQKLINSHQKLKELNFPIIISVLIIALLTISTATPPSGSPDPFSSPEVRHYKGHTYCEIQKLIDDSKVEVTSYENFAALQKIRSYTDIIFLAGGIATLILISFIFLSVTSEDHKITKNPLKTLHSLKPRAISKERERSRMEKIRLFTAIPILCIITAELLIFSGKMGTAVWLHIVTLIALSLSNLFIKDYEVNNIHQALMLLPILRLINLSVPIFFDTTLYTFVFIYGPLAIPVAVIVTQQQNSIEKIGISMKNIGLYMILSVPLGFLLGLGEYMTIRTGYLVPDLTFGNLLKLTIIMVFFVGLVEEIIFRSILQTRLEEALSVQEALLITSILFGLMHSGYGTFQEILYTSFVGFIMGFIFYKTRSLPFITVLHGFVNVFLFGILPHYLSGWTGL